MNASSNLASSSPFHIIPRFFRCFKVFQHIGSYFLIVISLQVKFNITDDTTLADLLALNLHKYEEEVKTIVDKSVKEAAMEKTLK